MYIKHTSISNLRISSFLTSISQGLGQKQTRAIQCLSVSSLTLLFLFHYLSHPPVFFIDTKLSFNQHLFCESLLCGHSPILIFPTDSTESAPWMQWNHASKDGTYSLSVHGGAWDGGPSARVQASLQQ